MSESKNKLDRLLQMIAMTQEDSIDCDECLQHIAQYAEEHLQGMSFCEQMQAVKRHLEACPCCKDEFDVFMSAIQQLKSEDDACE